MYQDAVRRPIGAWAQKRLAKLAGKSACRHNSENSSGFGRDLRNRLNKNSVLPGNTVSVPLVGKNMGHPAAFPVGLPKFFINLFTKPGDNVLDPFAGSGTTGLAALELKRNVVLIDTKEEYVNVMVDRISRKSPPRLFFYQTVSDAELKKRGQSDAGTVTVQDSIFLEEHP
jgi:site-specific DNA-methyltransferase (adenine-specific)